MPSPCRSNDINNGLPCTQRVFVPVRSDWGGGGRERDLPGGRNHQRLRIFEIAPGLLAESWSGGCRGMSGLSVSSRRFCANEEMAGKPGCPSRGRHTAASRLLGKQAVRCALSSQQRISRFWSSTIIMLPLSGIGRVRSARLCCNSASAAGHRKSRRCL